MTHPTYRQPLYRGLAVAMATLLALPVSVAAQAPAVAGTPATETLRILPLAGNNAVNDLEHGLMAPVAVQVLDQNDLPVEGATVIFRFPINGPSATFANQQTSQTVQTAANGQARATGWSANGQVGTFVIQVTATRGSEQGLGTITMTNVTRVLPEKSPLKRKLTSKWAKIGYIAAAAAITATIVLKSRGGDTTIQGVPGVPTIGGPQ